MDLFPLPDLDTHPDGALLRAIGRAEVISEGYALAQRRGERALRQHIRTNCQEAVRLANLIATTPARTPEGVLAKVEHALRDVDPEEPDFGGIVGGYQSALWDVLRVREARLMDAIARSLAAAPPGQTMGEWARTSAEGRMLLAMRELTEPQQEAWLRCLRRMVDGMPGREAAVLMYHEVGMDAAEAEALAQRVLDT